MQFLPVFDSVHWPELGQMGVGLLDKGGEGSWVSAILTQQESILC